MASDRNDGDVTRGTLRHVHRFDGGSTLSSVIRSGVYEPDQRASTIRFAGATPSATNPLTNPVPVTLETLGPNTVFNRGTQLKIQSLHTTYVQSDYKTPFQTGGLGHELLTGVDAAQEKKEAQRATTPPGVDLTKPQTFYGSPFDGASIGEDTRLLSTASRFKAQAYGVYLQDLVQVAPHWKLLGGLRYDHMDGRFDNVAVSGALNTYEQKKQLPQDGEPTLTLQTAVLAALNRHAMFFSAALPKRVFPPLFNRYAGAANAFGNHVDNAIR